MEEEDEVKAGKSIAWSDVSEIYDTLTLTQGLFGAAYSLADKLIPNVDDRRPIDAAIYALEEKVESAETKLNELMDRLKPS